ncbi:MAG: class I tRNA ligase family protein, partial [Myxococcales bacterium]|nr:class I tRNA ligase family protein [Myxococcales bacterium]
LANFDGFLRQWVADEGRLQPEIRKFVESWLEGGLRDWCISRDAPYFGFEIPDAPGKYFYVWLDAPIGYISSTENWAKQLGQPDLVDAIWRHGEGRVVHVIGKDIVYFHTLFWPAMLNAAGLTVPSKIPVYFPRMYNPVWINPDGFRWIEVLRDESKIELAINPSPIWSETNWFMDYILPTGLSGERHDQHSEPTNTEAWVAFRQPVLRAALEKMGWEPKDPARATLEAHMKAGLGEIWEENEFFINLLFHHVDPDGALGIRQYWESRARPGNPVTIAEY